MVQKNTFIEVIARGEVNPRGRSAMSEPSRSRETTPEPTKAFGQCWQQESPVHTPRAVHPVPWTLPSAWDQGQEQWDVQYDCGQVACQQVYCVPQGMYYDANGQPMQITFVPYDQSAVYYCPTGSATGSTASTNNPSSAGSDDGVIEARNEEHLLGPDRREKKGDGKKKKGKGGKSSGGKVFVGGLASKTTEETLLKVFSKFGKVAQANVLLDPQSRRSRGFGYVTFVGEVPEGVSGKDHMIDGRSCGARLYKYN